MNKITTSLALLSSQFFLVCCAKNTSNTHLQCTLSDTYAFEEFSLSPNGLYLVQRVDYKHIPVQSTEGRRVYNRDVYMNKKYAKPQINEHHKENAHRYDYAVQKTLEYLQDKDAITQHSFYAICNTQCRGYFWTAYDALIYKDFEEKFGWYKYDPLNNIKYKDIKNPYNQFRKTPRKLSFGPAFTANILPTTWFGWQVNHYDEKVLRKSWTPQPRNGEVEYFNRGEWLVNWGSEDGGRKKTFPPDEYNYLQIGQGGGSLNRRWIRNGANQYVEVPKKIEGEFIIRDTVNYKEMYKYNRDVNDAALIVSNKFRTAKHRAEHPITDDLGIDYFYFLSNEGHKNTTLKRYIDSIGGGVFSEVFAFDRANIEYVSSNRDATSLYWAYSDSPTPEYHFFSEDAKTLYDLIDMKAPHRSEIISMDSAGDMVIIKRQSGANIIDYILVSTQNQATRVLLSCRSE